MREASSWETKAFDVGIHTVVDRELADACDDLLPLVGRPMCWLVDSGQPLRVLAAVLIKADYVAVVPCDVDISAEHVSRNPRPTPESAGGQLLALRNKQNSDTRAGLPRVR